MNNHSGRASTNTGLDSTFKILITTDNHLGYMERDSRRGNDSFTTFEEILRAARIEHEVDCMFLGGDLFHENKPSLGCLNRTCTLFRKYLWGNKPVEFSLRSNAADNFPTHGLHLANWQDPNMNISVPVFAIHGNHDDPVGGTSSLDILANNGHLNYFGLVASLEDIVVQPVLLQKGSTYLALYGLGNIRDDRLHRCFQLKKIHFVKPKQSTDADGVPIRWFSILILHQNRGLRAANSKSGITEEMLAPFGFQLVIWGNEHEQRMVPEPTPHKYDIVQPGSSIVTSITPLEGNPKQYGVLEIRGLSYRLTPFPLRSVRPLVRRTIELCHDNPRGRTLEEVEEFLRLVVDEMISEAEQQLANIPDDVLQFHPNIRFPLMRLSVDFSDPDSAAFPQPNFIRFGQQYMDVVANPDDMLKEIRASDKRSAVSRAAIVRKGTLGKNADAVTANGVGGVTENDDAFHYAGSIPQFRSVDIATKVAEVFRTGIRPPCQVISEMELSTAVYAFAEKNERDAIEDKMDEMLATARKMVWKRLGDSDDILRDEIVTSEMHRCKVEREKKFFKELKEMALAQGESEDDIADTPAATDDDSDHRRGKDAPAEADGNDVDPRCELLPEVLDGVRQDVGNRGNKDDRGGGTRAPDFLLDHMQALHNLDEQAKATKARRQPLDVPAMGKLEQDASAAVLGEEELEELPDDGLSRVPVEEFVLREMEEYAGIGNRGGQKRGRVQVPVSTYAVEVDVDSNDDADVVVSQAPRNGGGHLGQPTATKRKTERKPRGKRSETAATRNRSPAPGGGLNLVPGTSGGGGGGAVSRRSAAQGQTGAVGGIAAQPLILSKWGASQQRCGEEVRSVRPGSGSPSQ